VFVLRAPIRVVALRFFISQVKVRSRCFMSRSGKCMNSGSRICFTVGLQFRKLEGWKGTDCGHQLSVLSTPIRGLEVRIFIFESSSVKKNYVTVKPMREFWL
jgi:hypothetical protein